MTRRPLRPLARILAARRKGEDPDRIEAENLHRRMEELRERERQRAETRLFLVGLSFAVAFGMIAFRMGAMAISEPAEPRADRGPAPIRAQRADIVDRNGNLLATNIATNALYAQPGAMIDPARAAAELARIFPELDEGELLRKFTSGRKFIWIRRKLSPEQMQAVHDIGEPGLLFAPREMRLYPNGRLAAHVLGGATFGREAVYSAEVVGVAGIERAFDARLRDPALADRPLRLSLDLSVQAAMRRVLEGGMRLLKAKGAAAVMMDVKTGEVLGLVSLPDFDPNARPRPATGGDPSDSPLFNRAAQGVYELGSTFKPFAAAQAIDIGLMTPEQMIDTRGPIRKDGFTIKDLHPVGAALSLTDVIVKSSNIGAARVATAIGGARQQRFLEALGLFAPLDFELPEARHARPILPARWNELATMTVSYGHGIAVSPLHLAAAYATLVNGGRKVRPTLLARDSGDAATRAPRPARQVIDPDTSRRLRAILRQVVVRGTARNAEVPGYEVAGKTGTADKPNPKGGYYKDKVISTFASFFPASAPRYVLIVTLDEPVETSGPKPRRTAGWTAAPVAAEIIRRVAPILGMRPKIEPAGGVGYTLSKY